MKILLENFSLCNLKQTKFSHFLIVTYDEILSIVGEGSEKYFNRKKFFSH